MHLRCNPKLNFTIELQVPVGEDLFIQLLMHISMILLFYMPSNLTTEDGSLFECVTLSTKLNIPIHLFFHYTFNVVH